MIGEQFVSIFVPRFNRNASGGVRYVLYSDADPYASLIRDELRFPVRKAPERHTPVLPRHTKGKRVRVIARRSLGLLLSVAPVKAIEEIEYAHLFRDIAYA